MSNYWNAVSGLNEFVDWYDRPSSSEFEYNAKQFAKNVPFVGWWLDAHDNSRKMNDYLANRGLDWSDIRYNGSPFGRTYGSAAQQTGTSVMSLYRNATRSMDRKKQVRKKSVNRAAHAAYRYNRYLARRGH